MDGDKHDDDHGKPQPGERNRWFRETHFPRPGGGKCIRGFILYDDLKQLKTADGTGCLEVQKGVFATNADAGSDDGMAASVLEALQGLFERLTAYGDLDALPPGWAFTLFVVDGAPAEYRLIIGGPPVGLDHQLTVAEQAIIDALRQEGRRLTTDPLLCKALGKVDGHGRGLLAGLVKRGIIVNRHDNRGYGLPEWPDEMPRRG